MIFVVGGGSGIGKACVDVASQWEDTMVLTKENGYDVRNINWFHRALNEFGIPSGVVYSAGINRLDWLGQTDPAEAVDIMDTNAMGFMWMCNTIMATEAMRDSRIVAIGSDAAERPMRTSMAYCASKAALAMMVRVAAREMASRGHRVNCVQPGMTAPTGMSAYIDARVPELRNWTDAEAMAYEAQQAVIKYRISPSEVAVVVWDVLNGPDHLNGAIINVNGGR